MFDTYSTISVVVGALLSSTKAVTKLQGTGAEWAGGWRCQPAASLISHRRTAKGTVMMQHDVLKMMTGECAQCVVKLV